MEMIKDLYSLERLQKSKYLSEIEEKIRELKNIKEFELEKKETEFRNIISDTIIPLKVYNENIKFIDEKYRLYKSEKGKKRITAFDELSQFTVSIPRYMSKGNTEFNKFEQIGICCLNYDEKVGLINEKDDSNFAF